MYVYTHDIDVTGTAPDADRDVRRTLGYTPDLLGKELHQFLCYGLNVLDPYLSTNSK